MTSHEKLIPVTHGKMFVREVGEGHPVILLHGFLGASEDFLEIAQELEGCRCVIPDLPGHGRSPLPKDSQHYSMRDAVKDLEDVCDAFDIDNAAMLGYSMGGRMAIGFAATCPQRLSHLILESASPGLMDETERLFRREHDEKLASDALRYGMETFVDHWEGLPLFASQTSLTTEARRRQRSVRVNQNSEGIAFSLRQLGTGSQPQYWSELGSFRVPTLLVTGQYDSKFTRIAGQMARRIPDALSVVVFAAGHNVHLETPAIFTAMVRKFLAEEK